MIGLGFLFFSALTLLLYWGWLALIVKLYRRIEGPRFFLPLKLLVATLLALAPLYDALVFPLIRNECNLNGRGIKYSKDASLVRDLVIEGRHYGLESSFPVLELFSTGRIDSVYFGEHSSYGESDGIVSAAQIHDGNGFDLRVSDSANVACGPYYKFVSAQQNPPPLEEANCLALSRASSPESYVRISRAFETRRSWRTAFHAIEWQNTKFDLVSPAERKPIEELREFTHKGLGFPVFLSLMSIGDFVCKAEKTPDVILSELLPEQELSDKKTALTKEFAISKAEDLTKKFWKFDVPEKAFLFEVGVWDHNQVSSSRTPLSVTLNVPKRDAPVFLQLMSNSPVGWIIQADQGQAVFVEQFVPKQGDTVEGVQQEQVWKFDDKEKKQNYLLKSYYEKILQIKLDAIQQHRFCKITRVPTTVKTTLVLDSCDK